MLRHGERRIEQEVSAESEPQRAARGPREGGSRSGDGRREHGNTDPFSVGEEMHPIRRDVAEDLGDRLMREVRGGAAKRDDESVHGFSDPPSRTPPPDTEDCPRAILPCYGCVVKKRRKGGLRARGGTRTCRLDGHPRPRHISFHEPRMSSPPKTQYTKSGDVHIAYQVTGTGPLDLVFVPGFVSHLEYQWEYPESARFF